MKRKKKVLYILLSISRSCVYKKNESIKLINVKCNRASC